MNIKQMYYDYKFARSQKVIAKQKLDGAMMDISSSMNLLAYDECIYNEMNLPKCINLIFIDSDREVLVQHCKNFDKDLDCLECKNCKYYDKRKCYTKTEKEFEIAQQNVKVARRNLINDIKNIFTLGR